MMDRPAVDISVIVPVFNEGESLRALHAEIGAALAASGRSFEEIYVDDGSTDAGAGVLGELAAADPRVKVVTLRRNFGQTAALAAGFDHARGKVLVPLDGDGQNDPADIPKLLEKIDAGFDVASGWRKDRREGFSRRFPSWVANVLIAKVTGVRLHDHGCTLKAYRAEVIGGTRLYGEMHRFIPALVQRMGARICEVPVTHRPRRFGTSHYGLGRTLKVLLDLLTVKFLMDYSTKPLYFFGVPGAGLCAGGVAAGAVTLWQKYVLGVWAHKNPLLLLAVFLFSLGMNLILMGLLAEVVIRTYHESQKKPIYWVRGTVNL
jgi:glycosyltransferase involved in cell wall biosynthesis